MLKKFTSDQIKVNTKKCSRCGQKTTMSYVVAGKLLCAKCKKEMLDDTK